MIRKTQPRKKTPALEAVATGLMKRVTHKRYGSTIERLVAHEGENRHARRAASASAHEGGKHVARTPAKRDPKRDKRNRKAQAKDRARNRRFS